jgi:hypothetical protein
MIVSSLSELTGADPAKVQLLRAPLWERVPHSAAERIHQVLMGMIVGRLVDEVSGSLDLAVRVEGFP